MFQFLLGIILVQSVTAGLMLAAFAWSHDIQLIIVFVTIAITCSVLAAFWFSSIARNLFNHEQTYMMRQHASDRERILKQAEQDKTSVLNEKSKLQDQHAREREKILLDAERDKAETIADSYRKIDKESRKVHRKANFKVGAAFAVAAGAGGVMIFSQLVTIGVMFLVASGSGLSGYVLRARHERLSRNRQVYLSEQNLNSETFESSPEQKRLQNKNSQ